MAFAFPRRFFGSPMYQLAKVSCKTRTVETGFYKLVEQLVAEKLRANSGSEVHSVSKFCELRLRTFPHAVDSSLTCSSCLGRCRCVLLRWCFSVRQQGVPHAVIAERCSQAWTRRLLAPQPPRSEAPPIRSLGPWNFRLKLGQPCGSPARERKYWQYRVITPCAGFG